LAQAEVTDFLFQAVTFRDLSDKGDNRLLVHVETGAATKHDLHLTSAKRRLNAEGPGRMVPVALRAFQPRGQQVRVREPVRVRLFVGLEAPES
jgi:hypothetical protein